MSTRWYPIYQRGNPQLRVFLPNFWMKLIRPTEEQPPNVVTFSVSMEMTKYDVRSYLEKIYKLPVVDVRTRIALGETKKDQAYGYITKKDDVKLAYVTLPREESFVFPDFFAEKAERQAKEEKSLDESKEGFRRFLDRNKKRPGTPGWFSI
ncbi:large ribosomal subunit protein uL23m [Drosophila suzukii]|uniref:Large ribosomal subunit protein uL23m n=1 Tax=Drosophila suzukii TaxID=28584 RepID=A0AB39ZCV3_DROSZ|nr:39S ribosomal protein L23, mitochondrial [Drosophila suzukii]XP_037719249.1 39S ribosomal protein L23, mitochondrial [Drosophila subpulchrella]